MGMLVLLFFIGLTAGFVAAVDVVQDVTAVQLLLTRIDEMNVLMNWIAPENSSRPVTGYAVKYGTGRYVPAERDFVQVLVDGITPKATLDGLTGDTNYHVKVAPRFGNDIGRFSDPVSFETPLLPQSEYPLPPCGNTETADQIRERVSWWYGRSALIGLPLPYCDDYYAFNQCHGTTCFCIPGRPPPGSCISGTRQTYGDDPDILEATSSEPCHEEYKAARKITEEAAKTGKTLNIRFPYCTEDGYYKSKQCLGSMCYCSTKEGKHTGKELPIWEAQTLVCCKYGA